MLSILQAWKNDRTVFLVRAGYAPGAGEDWLDGINKGTPRLFAPAEGAGATR